MGYSKISSIELINFMSFKKARLTFDESNILNIKGYNDSGKSAILRGIAVCLMDMFKRNQMKFIRHGEEYFRVVVTFDDGVSILRDKYINGQSLYEVYKNQDLLFTTKQGNRLSKIDGVPKPIADYLGLCVTDSVYLNYQSCIDRLPVVDTTGSENYQMFHEVLRMEEIYRANNMINLDKNDLGLDISTMEYDIQRDEVLLSRCSDVSEDFINEIEKLEERSVLLNNKKENLENIQKILLEYNKIRDIPKIEKVDLGKLKKLSTISEIISNLDNIVSLPEIKKVSSERLNFLHSICSIVDKLQKYNVLPEVPKVDETLLGKRDKLSNIENILNTLKSKNNDCSIINTSLNELKVKLNSLVLEAKSKGINLVKCENCGCYTEVGGGHTHE